MNVDPIVALWWTHNFLQVVAVVYACKVILTGRF